MTYKSDFLAISGLDYWWELNGDETDSIGSANSDGGTDPSWVTSIVPNASAYQCGDYNGTSSETDIPNQSDINSSSTTQKSIHCWVDIDTIDTSNGGRVIWGEGGATNGLALYVYNDGGTPTLYFNVYESSTRDILSWTGITTGTLYFISAILDCTNGEMYLYVNGLLVASKTGGLNISTSFSSHSAGAAIGGVDSNLSNHTGATLSGFFDGRIADVGYVAESTPTSLSDHIAIYQSGIGSNEIVSAQSGNWSSGSTWIGGVPPGDGDIAVRTVDHVITVDSNVTVGSNGDSYSPAIKGPVSTGTDNGGFIIASGVILTLKGSFICGGSGAYLILNAGSNIIMDSSVSNNHKIAVSNGDYVAGSLTVNGNSSNWCSIDNQGSGNLYLQSANGGDYWYYCESWYGSYLRLKNITGASFGGDCQIDHWIFDENSMGDSLWPLPNVPGDKDFIMNNCSFLNPTATIYLFFDDVTTGSRELKNNVFVSELFWSGSAVWDGLVLLGGTNGGGTNKGILQNSFLDPSAGSGLNGAVFTLQKDNFFYVPSIDNPHFIAVTPDISTTFDGNIFEFGSDWVSDLGDCILATGGGSVNYTTIIKNNIELPNASGRQTGTMASLWADIYNDVQIYNNTFYTGVNIEDDGNVSLVSVFYNNLSYGPNGQYLTSFSGGGIIEDVYDDADYNSAQNLTNPYFDLSKFLITPGSNDLNTDPQLLDSTRDLAKWAVAILGSGSGTESDQRLDAINSLIAQNDPDDSDYNVLATVTNLISYIKNGFAPTNMSYATAGKGGSYLSYIGAVEPIEAFVYDDNSLLMGMNF